MTFVCKASTSKEDKLFSKWLTGPPRLHPQLFPVWSGAVYSNLFLWQWVRPAVLRNLCCDVLLVKFALSLSSSNFLIDQFDFQENQNENISKNSKLHLAKCFFFFNENVSVPKEMNHC